MTLDQKDRRILADLDRDARAPNSRIAKSAGLSKQVVDYRIRRLMKKGIIKGFITIIDSSVLGYGIYKILLRLEKTTQEDEKGVLQYLVAHPSVAWVATSTGKWEILIVVFARSVQEFSEVMLEISEHCGEQVQEYEVLTVVGAYPLGYKWLFEQSPSERIGVFKAESEVRLDKLDVAILEELDRNGRMPTAELARKTKATFDTVRFRMNRLRRFNVIKAYKPVIDVYKLGYQWYLVLFRLHSLNREKLNRFVSFAKEHRSISYLNHYVGNWELSIEVHVKSPEEFRELLIEIKNQFSQIIRNYDSILIFSEQKYTFFPEVMRGLARAETSIDLAESK